MDKLKLIIKIFVFSCLFILLSPIVIQFIVTTPSSFGFITPETQDTWINFFGAIIGGGATLLGVWWTIVEQKKDLKEQQKRLDDQRRDDLAIQYKPLIEIEDNGLEEYKYNQIKIKMKLSNIGRGEALNLFVKIFQENGDNYYISNTDIFYNIFPSKKDKDIDFVFTKIDASKEFNKEKGKILATLPLDDIEYNFKGIINYDNPFSNKRYILNFSILLEKIIPNELLAKKNNYNYSNKEINERRIWKSFVTMGGYIETEIPKR